MATSRLRATIAISPLLVLLACGTGEPTSDGGPGDTPPAGDSNPGDGPDTGIAGDTNRLVDTMPTGDASTSDTSVGDSAPGGTWTDRCSALHVRYAAPPVPGPALRTLYVDAAGGSDSNGGLSPTDAWQTLSRVNDSVRAGDWVMMSGDFVDDPVIPKASGTVDDRIVYQSTPGQIATLTLTSGSHMSAIAISGRDYIVIDGLSVNQNGTGDGIFMNAANNNWLRNIDLQGGINRMWTSQDNRIEDCTISSSSAPLYYVRDGVSRNVFARNFYGGASIAFGMNDMDVAPSLDNVWFANDFSNHEGNSITISGLAQRTQFLCNTVRESGINTEFHYLGDGMSRPEAGAGPAFWINASENVVRYNEFYENKWETIRLNAFGDCSDASNVKHTNDNLIQHNVFYNNGGTNIRVYNSGPGPSGCGATPLWGDIRGNQFENNIFWENAQFCDFHFCAVPDTIYAVVFDFFHTESNGWPNGASGLNGNVIRNNFIGLDEARVGDPWLRWAAYTSGESATYNLGEAETAFDGEIVGNSEGDPQFNDAAAHDFRPQPTSPAIDFGAPIPGLSFEGAAPEPGRYEFVP